MKFIKLSLIAFMTVNFFISTAMSARATHKKATSKTIKRAVVSTSENVCGDLVMGARTTYSVRKNNVEYFVESNDGWPTKDNAGNRCGYEVKMCLCGVQVTDDSDGSKLVQVPVPDEKIKCGANPSCN